MSEKPSFDDMALAAIGLQDERDRLKAEIDRLTAELAAAKEALTFYADKENYHQTGWQGDPDWARVLSDYGKRARDALASSEQKPPAERQWLPIESAPKDGTTIIGWWDEARIAVSVYYDEGGWVDDANSVEAPEPTHWMPLPDPPAENERPTESV